MSSIVISALAWTTPEGRAVFSDLDLTFGRERVGLVGRNGIGKTTLLQIISGELQPTAGSIAIDGTVAEVKQSVRVDPCDTVADIFGVGPALSILCRAEAGQASLDDLAAADWQLEERVNAALARVGLDPDTHARLADLSGGQRTRASLAAAMFRKPDFLLLDEPTNDLDRDGRRAVHALLADWRGGAIVVSHDRELLGQMDAIVELTSLGATRYGGNWDAYRALKAVELEAAERDLAFAEARTDEIERNAQRASERQDRRNAAGARKGAQGGLPKILLGARKGNAQASRGRSIRRTDRQSTEAQRLAAEARTKVEILQPLSITLPPTGLAPHRQVLSCDAVTAGYGGGAPLIRDLSFSLSGPERVAIVGPNGAGKTTLLKLIAGEVQPLSGRVAVSVEFAMLDQHMGLLNPRSSILDNFKRLNPGSDENACRAALASFLFRADAALQTVCSLSGGQMFRAGLACVLGGQTPRPLLLLDEPTNHLDIASVEAIEAALAAYDGALLVVSHDERFLTSLGIDRYLSPVG
ncbi:MAG TPA: ABC-F family ATP-binding cassette domain-containing protein [Bosea sp. (in: a-proteobacteria)]|uniref:ABC-F family ATP-binding cassette domain-containing protein n=1 Tax=Bosea sp. (in: a-proteobacteria) TaxID=1871050 RepID=UPI002E11CD58|nr:ABC-F family ATP-binding cassette domain-containing protein [Bosea sp. (in: a-proteobacteria)]